MNDYKTFRVTIIDDEASVIKCEYPLVSNVVMYKVCAADTKRFDQTIQRNIPGVYIIRKIDKRDDSDSLYRYYIGQTIEMAQRMRYHNRNKNAPLDFIYCTLRKEDDFPELQGCLQYIETQIIEKADNTKLENSDTKSNSNFKISQDLISVAEKYINQFVTMASLLGYKELFNQSAKEALSNRNGNGNDNNRTDVNVMLTIGEADAHGIYYADNSLKVLAGSRCGKSDMATKRDGGNKKYDLNLIKTLKEKGYLSNEGIFLQDKLFESPSKAARIILGYPISGLIAWHVNKDESLNDYIGRIATEM